MRRLTPEHYVLLAGFLAVLGLQLGTMGDSWDHAKSPQFWGGVLAQAALLLRAIYTKEPSTY